jgi:hypothetical protein
MTYTQKRLNSEREPDVWEIEKNQTMYEFPYGTYEDISYYELFNEMGLYGFLNNVITKGE